MSVEPTNETIGLPVVNQATEPAWVRHGSSAVQQDYATALSFEQTLVEQLSKSLVATSGLGGQGESSGEGSESEEGTIGGAASGNMLSSLLPQALAGGVVGAGGLGLAEQLTRQLEGVGGATSGETAGGSSATSTQQAEAQPPGTQTSAATGGAAA
jgi:hypothetical protein